MDFRIESQWHDSPKPKAQADLKTALEQARDKWLETTPQRHEPGTVEYGRLEAAAADIEQMRTLAKDAPGAEQLRKANDRYREIVKTYSATPTPETAGALALINAGIQAAVIQAQAISGKSVRASIVGRFELPPEDGHSPRPRESVIVSVDIAG